MHAGSGILHIPANFPAVYAFKRGSIERLVETAETEHVRTERSGVGMTLGVITFLVGVCLLLLTFKLAYDMFSVPPTQVISSNKDNAVDLARSGDNLATIGIRVLLLIVMGLMGSLIANRGVSMFTSSRTKKH
jgi:hypothetical protein